MTTRHVLALAFLVPAMPAWADPVASVAVTGRSEQTHDDWFAVDAPVLAVPDADGASMGFAPSIGVFRDNGHGAIGARFRGGFVNDRVTDETRTTGTLGFVFRVGMLGPWAEVGGGAGMHGEYFGLSAEVGVGWDFRLGGATVSLSARYVHFDLDMSMDSQRSDGVLAGVGTYFGRAERSRVSRSSRVVSTIQPARAPVSGSCSAHE